MPIAERSGGAIKTITLGDPDYPARLREIYNSPSLLYYRGCLDGLKNFNGGPSLFSRRPALAVVGSRRATVYGEQVLTRLIKDLISYNFVIISGLALGIDAWAHQKTLENNGLTVAVLGSGLDRASFYPPENWNLAEKIIARGGAVISEFRTGTPPLRNNFPRRNRLLSGLADGVLVVEAGERSGALITARHALEQGREVLAVPGNIFSDNSASANNLIKQGASAVTGIDDILAVFNLDKKTDGQPESKAEINFSSPAEEKIFSILSLAPAPVEEIMEKSALDIAAVNSTLCIMELKGIAKNVGQNKFIKNNF